MYCLSKDLVPLSCSLIVTEVILFVLLLVELETHVGNYTCRSSDEPIQHYTKPNILKLPVLYLLIVFSRIFLISDYYRL